MKQKIILRLIGTACMLAITTALWASDTFSPTQWYRIRTPHFDILFRGNFSQEARRLANTLACLYEPVSESLGVKPPRISIVLRNQLACSNGEAALGPRRVDFFTFPTQDCNFLGTNDWLNGLAIHEFRHVAQFAKLYQGLNKVAYWLGGDYLLNTVNFANVPRWFFEGDAVGIETALTQSGRGRIPYFSLLYKANLLERGGFGYQKQIFGSFKDKIPSPRGGGYEVGYYMTTHLRRKYGANVLADILQKTTSPNLFYMAVKKVTGKTPSQIYQDTNQELKELWEKQLQGLKVTPAQRLNPRDNTDYTDYYYPQIDPEGNIAVLKSGIGTVHHFVWLDEQQRAYKIFTPGHISAGTGFSLAQGKITWVEEVPDLWRHDRTYSVIQLYDIETNQLKTLTHKSRYSSAALSPDATKIVAFESDEAYNHQLVILDAQNGQVLQRLPNPENHFYMTPRWAADGQHIIAIKHVQQKATIALINTSTGKAQDLIPYAAAHIGCPNMQGGYVFYNSAYSGIDNIYAIDLKTHQCYQITSRKYGAYNATLSSGGQWIYFNDFTKDGMDVVKMPFDPQQWTPLEKAENRSVNYYAPLVEQENNAKPFEQIPNHDYPVEAYHPWKHCLNIHSWLPHVELNSQQEELGLQVSSRDLLGTTESAIGYTYDFKKELGNIYVGLDYQTWYPVISLEGGVETDYKTTEDPNRYNAGLAFKFPLQFMHGQYSHSLSGKVGGDIHKMGRDIWFTQSYETSFLRHAQPSPRDIAWPWAQRLDLGCFHTPYEGARQEEGFFAKAEFWFPGLFKHHSLYLNGIYKVRKEKISRDSSQAFNSNEKEAAYEKILTSYSFPIYYPDWDVYPLYIRRLRADVWGKRTRERDSSIPTQPSYYLGLDLLADTHLFSLPIPLEIGVCYVYPMEKDEKSYFGPLFQVKL